MALSPDQSPPPPPGYPPQNYPPQGYPPQSPPSPQYSSAPGGAMGAPYLPKPMFKRRPGYRNSRRLTAAIMLTLGFVLVVVAIATPWWSFTISGSGSGTSITATVSFLPGNSASISCTGACSGLGIPIGTVTYSSTSNLTSIGNLYGGVYGLLVGALVLSIIALVFAFLGAFGLNFGRGQLTLTILLGLVSFALMLGSVVWVLGGQGSALSSGGLGCATGTSPASSFWGSNSGSCLGIPASSSITYSWGAAVGWYIALVGCVLLLIGTMLLLFGLREPYTASELGVPGSPTMMAAPAPQAPPFGGSTQGWTGQPPAQPAYPVSQPPAAPPPAAPVAPPTPNCASCGRPTTFIAQYGRYYCYACGRYV